MTRFASALAFLVAMAASSAADAYCPGYDPQWSGYEPNFYSVTKEFRRSKFVVEGVVTRETWIGEDGKAKPLVAPYGPGRRRPWGIAAPFLGAWYEVVVTRSFKGNAPARLRLFSENSTARFWLNKGERYLLFVDYGPFDPPIGSALSIDVCGNSTTAKGGGKLLSKLAALGSRHNS